MERNRVLISGLPKGENTISESDLTMYFQSKKKSGGGEILKPNILEDGKALIEFVNETDARDVLAKEHYIKGFRVQATVPRNLNKIQQSPRSAAKDDISTDSSSSDDDSSEDDNEEKEDSKETCSILVKNLPSGITKDAIKAYFEKSKKKHGGGHVRKVDYKPSSRSAVVVFHKEEDAKRMVDFVKHKLKGTRLDVTNMEPGSPENEEDDDDEDDDQEEQEESGQSEINPSRRKSKENCAIPHQFIISGIGHLSTEESLLQYIENTMRSGGGVVNMLKFDQEKDVAEVKLESVKDLNRLLYGKHEVEGFEIHVTPKAPEEKVPMDPLKIQVKGLKSSTSPDCVRFYMEKMCNVEVQRVQPGGSGNALVFFAESPDFDELSSNIHKDTRGIEQRRITVERVPFCNSLLVHGLSSKITIPQIELCFESPSKGFGVVPSKIDLHQEEGKALVYFDDPSVIQKALEKPVYTFGDEEWKVELFYPFLNEEIPIKEEHKTIIEVAEIEVNQDVMDHITTRHVEELQNLQDHLNLEIGWTPRESTVKLQQREASHIKDCGEWNEAVKTVKTFIGKFDRKDISVDPCIWDEVLANVKETPQFDKVTIEYLIESNKIKIIAKKDDLQKASSVVETIIDRERTEKAMKDSIETIVEEDIDSHKLTLLRISDLYERLKSDKNVEMEINEPQGKLVITGPSTLLQSITMGIFKFFQKTKEEPLELPEGILQVLQSTKGKELIENRFREKQIHAVVVHGKRKAKNEASIFYTYKDQGKEAAQLLESMTNERSIHIEDKTVVNNPQWKTFVGKLEQDYKARISFQSDGQTLWISGIEPDARECYSMVEEYVDRNKIFTKFVKIDEGHLRFLFEICNKSIKEIEDELKDSFVKIAKEKGELRISGTKRGIEEANEKLAALIANSYKEEMKIEKPGMKRFFQEGQGAKLIKVVETEHKCVVEVAEDLPKHEMMSARKTDSTENGKCLYSYLTKEGKQIAVYKNDLTKHKVDVIVNAANGELQHYAGLAGAIVREGGKEIQEQCNKYIADNGTLLEGQVMVTGPGKLPCKKIIHAVGPRWNDIAKNEYTEGKKTRQENLLKYAIEKCLEHARNDQAIAIPAVSTGIFQFPVELCARILIDTVTEFFRENPGCKLSKVHFTNHDDATVKFFSDEMKERFGKECSFSESNGKSYLVPKQVHYPQMEFVSEWEVSDKKEVKPFLSLGDEEWATTTASQARNGDDAISTKEGIKIVLKVGNIAHEKADILVNTAGEALDLGGNACARAFRDVAGPTLQQECNKIAPVKPGNIGTTRSVGNLRLQSKYVTHAVCCMWKGNGKPVLQSILRKCFDEANRLGAASIAIPAIGTGVLKFPRDVVAELSFEEALQFSRKTKGQGSLKEVRFVVYDKDTPTIKAFKDEIMKRQSTFHSPGALRSFEVRSSAATRTKVPFAPLFKKRNDNWYEINMDSLSVHVQGGDITQETTDAIVVVSNPELDIELGGGAGAAIMRAGGDVVKRECKDHPKVLPGNVSMTSAGRLRTKKLVHYVPSDSFNDELLSKAVVDCLNFAENQRMSSISFPAIGTGKLGVSADRCAKAMLKGAISFSKQLPTTLQLIRIVVYQDEMIKDFVSVLQEITGQPKEKEVKEVGMFRRIGNYIGLTHEPKKQKEPLKESLQPSKILLRIYCRDLNDLTEAKRAISELVSKNCIQKVIENPMIACVEENQLSEIHSVELRFETRITVEKPISRIILHGNSDDVLEAVSAIHGILDRVRVMQSERMRVETIVKNISWQYWNQEKEVFVPYTKEANACIETAFNKHENTVTFQENGKRLTIHFSSNTVKGEGIETRVKRKDLLRHEENELLLPIYWATQPKNSNGVEEAVHLVDLSPDKHSKEYLKVSQLFKKTTSYKILNVCRVQNPAQYHNYATRKQKMEKEKGQGIDVERLLFHGTAAAYCESINKTAFNRNFKGQHATKYGQGTYFAVDAEFSARSVYSPPDPQGKRYMYLVRVLVGEYTNGEEKMLVPPPKNAANPTDRYDTVVDDASNPTIFVAFYDWQCYPEYLITFQ